MAENKARDSGQCWRVGGGGGEECVYGWDLEVGDAGAEGEVETRSVGGKGDSSAKVGIAELRQVSIEDGNHLPGRGVEQADEIVVVRSSKDVWVEWMCIDSTHTHAFHLGNPESRDDGDVPESARHPWLGLVVITGRYG